MAQSDLPQEANWMLPLLVAIRLAPKWSLAGTRGWAMGRRYTLSRQRFLTSGPSQPPERPSPSLTHRMGRPGWPCCREASKGPPPCPGCSRWSRVPTRHGTGTCRPHCQTLALGMLHLLPMCPLGAMTAWVLLWREGSLGYMSEYDQPDGEVTLEVIITVAMCSESSMPVSCWQSCVLFCGSWWTLRELGT